MATKQPTKTFDCVEYKRRAQQQIYEEIRDLPAEAQIEYFHRHAESGPLAEWWRKVVAAGGPREPAR